MSARLLESQPGGQQPARANDGTSASSFRTRFAPAGLQAAIRGRAPY